jgi:hypothetical protein
MEYGAANAQLYTGSPIRPRCTRLQGGKTFLHGQELNFMELWYPITFKVA